MGRCGKEICKSFTKSKGATTKLGKAWNDTLLRDYCYVKNSHNRFPEIVRVQHMHHQKRGLGRMLRIQYDRSANYWCKRYIADWLFSSVINVNRFMFRWVLFFISSSNLRLGLKHSLLLVNHSQTILPYYQQTLLWRCRHTLLEYQPYARGTRS